MPIRRSTGRGYRWYSLGGGCEFLGWSRTQAAAQARRGTVQTVWAADKPMARRIWDQTQPDAAVCRYSPAHQQTGVPATGTIWLEGLGMSVPACLECQTLYVRLSGPTAPQEAPEGSRPPSRVVVASQAILGCSGDPTACGLGASCPYPDCD